jgi:hypothetical protein
MLSMIIGSLLVCAPAYISEFYYRHAPEARNNVAFRQDHSMFLSGFRVKASLYNLMFYPIYLIRRTAVAAILVFLTDYPVVQLSLLAVSSIVVSLCVSTSSSASTSGATSPTSASSALCPRCCRKLASSCVWGSSAPSSPSWPMTTT